MPTSMKYGSSRVKFTLESNAAVNLITAYGGGEIVLRERTVRGSAIITPDRIIEWAPRAIEEVDLAALEIALVLAPDIVVLGTGERLYFPAAGLRARVQARGIGIEVMDTNAACRTYNVLVLEGRNVAAALLL
jgi:uncharacterized protein